MPTSCETPSSLQQERTLEPGTALSPNLLGELQELFGVAFAAVETATGSLVAPADNGPLRHGESWVELARAVSPVGAGTLLFEEEGLVLWAVPLALGGGGSWVAVAPFRTGNDNFAESLQSLARISGAPLAEVSNWLAGQFPWQVEVLERVTKCVVDKWRHQQQSLRLTVEIEQVSANLAATYEEISLLYGLTGNLRLSQTDRQLGRMALGWLADVLPVESLAIEYLPVGERDGLAGGRSEPILLSVGDCPMTQEEFHKLMQSVGPEGREGPLVLNRDSAAAKVTLPANVRQMILLPIYEGENHFGWLAAFNHTNNKDFGTVEANLLSSVATLLGIHSGNIELYRRQAEFTASVVKALTSAIDAKDPYTCGHSDRVALVSVRLAKELGFDEKTLHMLYMAGLLHDVGKIGVDDNVLRKPGRLTEAEFQHIKLHPELGHKILTDLKQLREVLPIVLHHHEQWDGRGYPHALAGENIPILARIVAVADAYDAMSSDRPYRQGMPDEKVHEVFRQGAGKQWDPNVVEAFMRIKDEVRELSRRERDSLVNEVTQWT